MDNLPVKDKLESYKIPLALGLVGAVLIAGGIFASGLPNTKPKAFPKESLVESQKLLSVDVSGAVVKPGVYQLREGSRIEEAIATAGGFTEAANKEFISKYLNLAQKISDGSKIYIPETGENQSGSQSGMVAGISTQDKVNINTALQAELEALPGIGAVTAGKIINSRPYQQIEDLLSKKVVGKNVFGKIKDQLVVY